jgi:hypothetical protein
MTPDRWRLISQVYHAAREREPGQRTAFLDHVCAGDEPLRRDLESLLREDGEDALFLEHPSRSKGLGLVPTRCTSCWAPVAWVRCIARETPDSTEMSP